MTFFMLILAFGTRTPVGLWLVAMVCDTVLLSGLMVLKFYGKM